MTFDRQKLRAAAVAASKSTYAASSDLRAAISAMWSLQTSNSFRRIGCHSDGDVLCAVVQRSDGHPDIHAAPHVLDYVVAAQPQTVLDLLDELRQCEEALALSRTQHAEDHAELERLRGASR